MHMLLMVGAVCGAVMAIFALLYGTYRLLRGIVAVEAALPTLMEIDRQFRPNGGDSLRDVLNRVEKTAERQERRLDRVEFAVKAAGWDQGEVDDASNVRKARHR